VRLVEMMFTGNLGRYILQVIKRDVKPSLLKLAGLNNAVCSLISAASRKHKTGDRSSFI
jgi:hypothetical protein